MIALMAAAVERSRSVSSILSSILPPCRRANSQLNKAVRPPPMCRKPVGEGAKRVTIVEVILVRAGAGAYADVHLYHCTRGHTKARLLRPFFEGTAVLRQRPGLRRGRGFGR